MDIFDKIELQDCPSPGFAPAGCGDFVLRKKSRK